MKLTVSYASSLPDLSGQWDSPLWRTVRPITIGCFLRESSAHRPITRVKVLHDDVSVRVMFSVHDRYVCCTRTEYGSDV
nr:hypothetical protein [Chitinispirillaceae bacterium]